MRERFKHFTEIKVRWGDLDALGHVNNAIYFTYMESSRFSYFQAAGIVHHWNHRFGPILASAKCNFRKPIGFPAQLDVGIRITEIRNSSFSMEHAIFPKGGSEVLADAVAVAVWMDYGQSLSLRVPEEMRRAIETFESA